MTTHPDQTRILKAKENRRKQLIEWEAYDQKYEESKRGSHKTRNPKINFGIDLIFLESAARGDIEEVKQLLKNGANPDVTNEDGLTALHQCCIDNNMEMCTLLLENHCNVNAKDNELWTPLHAAATCGHKELCALLIKWNADLLAINVEGNMPYDLCDDDETLMLVESEMSKRNVSQSQIDEIRLRPEREMLQDLIKRHNQKDDLNALDSQGAAPIHVASACGFVEAARFLLNINVNVHLPDHDGWQPIHIAVCWGQIEIVELLVSYGADMEAKTLSGQTVYGICDSKELQMRLKEIWNQREELRMACKANQLGFQRSRGSSRRRSNTNVLRTSMREKHNLSRLEAQREKQLGEQAEAQLLIAEQKNNIIDPSTNERLPINLRSTPKEPRSPPISVIQEPGFMTSEEQKTPSKRPTVLQNGASKSISKPDNDTNEGNLAKLPPMVPPRGRVPRNTTSSGLSQDSPPMSFPSSSIPSSTSKSSDSLKENANKTNSSNVMEKSPQGHLIPADTSSVSSNGSRTPTKTTPPKDYRSRRSLDSPQLNDSNHDLIMDDIPRDKKIDTQIPGESPKSLRGVTRVSDPIPTVNPGKYVSDSPQPYANMSSLSTDTINSSTFGKRKPFSCCHTM